LCETLRLQVFCPHETPLQGGLSVGRVTSQGAPAHKVQRKSALPSNELLHRPTKPGLAGMALGAKPNTPGPTEYLLWHQSPMKNRYSVRPGELGLAPNAMPASPGL